MKKTIIVLAVAMMFVTSFSATFASSVWIANGNATDTGGTLVGFNRDARPDGQSLQWIKGTTGLSYFALFGLDLFDQQQPIIGINKAGLLTATLPIATIPLVYKQDMTYNKSLLRYILKNCKNVDDALNHMDWFVGPQTVVIADGKQAVIVEIGGDSKQSVKQVVNGVACHTDHYLLPDMQSFNQKNNKLSTARYQQLSNMLKSQTQWTLDDFATIGQFQSESDAASSIFRVGNKTGAERTMSSWSVSLTPGKLPEANIMVIDDKMNEQSWFLNTGYVFSGESQFAISDEPLEPPVEQ